MDIRTILVLVLILRTLPFSRHFRVCHLHPTYRKAKCATILAFHRHLLDMLTRLIHTLCLLQQQRRLLCDKLLLPHHQVIGGVIPPSQLDLRPPIP